MEKKILFLSPYPLDKAPSQRLKFEQYYSAIENAGYEVTTKSFVSASFWKFIYQKGFYFKKLIFTLLSYFKRLGHLFTLRKYDVVYVHLWVTPFGFPFYEFLVNLIAKKLIYDIDDMIFLGHASNANKFVSLIKGKSKVNFLLKKADHVITCTPALDEYARKFNSKTTDISSTIDTDLYKPKDQRELSSPITLGWSGSYSTSKYLKLLEPVFLRLMESHEIEVLVIGDENFNFSNNSIPTRTLAWNLKDEVNNLNQIDIGLYPLPDEPWVYGKSGLKALQYMALEIPTIAQNLKGANQRIIVNGVSGFLAGTNEDWIGAIEKIIYNEELQSSMGKKARKKVEKEYSIKSTAPIYIDILNKV